MQLQDKNIILSYPKKICGSLFDVLEYYLFARQFSNDIYLIILDEGFKNIIINFLKKRYILNDLNFYLKNIIFITPIRFKYEHIFKYKFNKTFIFDLMIVLYLKKLPFFPTKKIYYITELTNEKFQIKFTKIPIKYISEMPFCKTDIKYQLKFFFDIYKKFDKFEDNLYINYPLGNIKEVENIIQKYNKNNILKKETFLTNKTFEIHKYFNQYLYIKSPYWFDTHPRLFHECYFYNKKFYYENHLNIKDGSWYRYYDLLDNGLKNRILTKNDYLIQEMISD